MGTIEQNEDGHLLLCTERLKKAVKNYFYYNLIFSGQSDETCIYIFVFQTDIKTL